MKEINKAVTESLILIIEECSEVQKSITKILRFGFDSVHNERSNLSKLQHELMDLSLAIEILNKLIDIEILDENERYDILQVKLDKLLTYTEHLNLPIMEILKDLG